MLPAALARASLPEPILEVLRRLSEGGFRSWLVGGAVRDLLVGRGRVGNDFDVATPALPDEVSRIFERVYPTGIDHGTVTVIAQGGEPVEVTTFRGEGAYHDGRRPSSVTFHSDIEADLARRDFTMNAIALDPLAGELRDPFRGRSDLSRRLVRAVGDPAARFGEDGLRPLRAVRFAAQLGFTLHRGTRAAIPGALAVVRKVSVERVAEELQKLACAPRVDRGVDLLLATGLLAVVLPELAALPRPLVRHGAAVAVGLPPDPALRLAGLLHVLPTARTAPLLLGLRLSRRVSDEAAALVAAHTCRARAAAPLPHAGEELRRWLAAAGRARAPALVALARAEARAAPAARRRKLLAEVRRLAADVQALGPEVPLDTRALALDGSAVVEILGAPGPHVGEALRHLLEGVLARPEENTPEKLRERLRLWWAARQPAL